jgi:hypothetical protein
VPPGQETWSAACARRRLECEWPEMLRTHYETLKITRDAPQEVVRAAYRALTLKYHPDRHAADPGATEMMALLNSAYETLSDPLKRREYDEWIETAQARPRRDRAERRTNRADWIGAPGASDPGASRFWRFRHYWVFYVLALVAIFLGSLWYESLYLHRSKALTPLASAMSSATQEPTPVHEPSLFARPPPPDQRPTNNVQAPAVPAESERQAAPPRRASPAAPPPSHAVVKPAPQKEAASPEHLPKPTAQSSTHVHKKIVEPSSAPESALADESYTRPEAAPNGEAWPSSSDYVAGYQQRNTNGLSQVVIDDTKNNSDAFVKIVSVGENEPKVVRNIFIQAGDRFTASNLRAGSYEIRYQNLDSGTLIRSEVFALEETAISSGTRYSTVTLTLRAKPEESMNTFALSKDEF